MANNRMYVRCIPCDQKVKIAKRMADGYYLRLRTDDTAADLTEFFDAHEWCDGTFTHGQDKFDLVYESGINPEYATRWAKPDWKRDPNNVREP